jgi:DNA topoisomerase-2
LPINKWTSDYKVFLEGMLKNEEIDGFKEFHKDNSISFVIKGSNLNDLGRDEVEKRFKLTTSISLNNLVLFDSQQRIKRYANEVDILEEFFPIRHALYARRKEYLLGEMRKELRTMQNKCRFIESVNDGSVVLRNRSKEEIVE